MASDDFETVTTISANWVTHEDISRLLSQNTWLFELVRFFAIHFALEDGIKRVCATQEAKLDVNEYLSQEETAIEMELKSERSFHRSELIFDHKKIAALAALHYSSVC